MIRWKQYCAIYLSSTAYAVAFLTTASLQAQQLQHAQVFVSASANEREKLAAQVLVEEVNKRSAASWQVLANASRTTAPAIVVTTKTNAPRLLTTLHLPTASLGTSHAPEGFSIRVLRGRQLAIVVVGNDTRGVLFGVGYLLRHLDMDRNSVVPHSLVDTDQSPKYSVRGHQLGYRPKNNTYDGWTIRQFEQYIRELAIFGTNTIELIPPVSDDALTSPLFPEPPMDMMEKLSDLIDQYGLDCSIWYPAMDKDYSDPATVNKAVAEWGATFSKLRRVDALFVPGGDPGHTSPQDLFHLLERVAVELHKYHPHAQIWVSPQAFSEEWLTQFYALVAARPKWLSGVVYGSEMRHSPTEFRKHIPAGLPIRFYPDITHTASSEQPVPNWDPAFLLTEGREPINPRPVDQNIIFHDSAPTTVGFVSYSEGVNDDVNKFLWTAWGWDPTQSAKETLEQYSRFFLSPTSSDTFVHAMMGLERNWRGPALTNRSIRPTLRELMALKAANSGAFDKNWRFQQLLYRGYYDAYVQKRLRAETASQKKALAILRTSKPQTTDAAIDAAIAALGSHTKCSSSELCKHVQEVADDLFFSIRMQLTASRHQASAVDRGANADSVDEPITDCPWILQRLAAARVTTGTARATIIRQVLNTIAPTSALYDDVGQPGHQRHVVPQPPALDRPVPSERIYSGVVKANTSRVLPMSWKSYLGTLFDAPMVMRYASLQQGHGYILHVIYAKSAQELTVTANDSAPLSPHCESTEMGPCTRVSYEISSCFIRKGKLKMQWQAPVGLGGHGRLLQIAATELVIVE